jgi:6-pyruvoyltetrahydropterin/6-carboxytetrahydropterin synthase
MRNGEREVILHSIIVHETDTGYAQAFKEDAHSELMGRIDLDRILFSEQVRREWCDESLWEKLLAKEPLLNPKRV